MRTVQRTQTRAAQTQRISPRLVAAGTILMMSSDELRQRLEEETNLNPALEMVWDTVCPTCGRGLSTWRVLVLSERVRRRRSAKGPRPCCSAAGIPDPRQQRRRPL